MRSINQLFANHGHFDHPVELVWEPRILHGGTACRIDWKPSELVRREARVGLVKANTGEALAESVEWNTRLNSFLLGKGVRAETPENEALRCSLALRDELEGVEDTFGDGFYNKALISYIQESEFFANKGIQEILSSLAPRQGGSFSVERAKDNIDLAISEVASPLIVKLNYPLEEASKILTMGVRSYLDVRFSFSTRKLLGWT